ncbi:MAG: hypothetical protein KA369_08465 [Spirochaetes bacterium]|nr:hypothetical protein [Spirochaetota bacterium]
MKRYQIEKQVSPGQWHPINEGYGDFQKCQSEITLMRTNMKQPHKLRITEVVKTRVID